MKSSDILFNKIDYKQIRDIRDKIIELARTNDELAELLYIYSKMVLKRNEDKGQYFHPFNDEILIYEKQIRQQFKQSNNEDLFEKFLNPELNFVFSWKSIYNKE